MRGQALPSLVEVSEVAGAQRRLSFTAGAKGSSRRAAEPPLKVLSISIWSPPAKTPRLPLQYKETREVIALELRGVRSSCLPMRSSPSGLFRLSFGTLI